MCLRRDILLSQSDVFLFEKIRFFNYRFAKNPLLFFSSSGLFCYSIFLSKAKASDCLAIDFEHVHIGRNRGAFVGHMNGGLNARELRTESDAVF